MTSGWKQIRPIIAARGPARDERKWWKGRDSKG